jgi:hypothetical protein
METIRMGSSRSRLVECIFGCPDRRRGGDGGGALGLPPLLLLLPQDRKGKEELSET